MKYAGKRLLILGGSRISCEIISRARKMGIRVGVTDWYPLEKSPAKQMADEAYYESTANIPGIVDLVKKQKFDGIITGFTDSVLPYYAEACGVLGFPSYGTKEQFTLFTDKKRYKQLLRQYDIPTIPEFAADPDGIAEEHYPLVIKPADGSGSRGISVCRTREEFIRALDFAKSFSASGEMVVEQYLDAPEVTLFWLFLEGEYHLILAGNRLVKHNQAGELPLPAGYTYPPVDLPHFLDHTAPKMKQMFADTGIRNGMMFMQCKVVEGEYLVYDLGYRLTGTLEYRNIEALCGYNPLDMLIEFALTGRMDSQNCAARIDPFLHGRYGYNVSILCKPGTVGEIKGLEDVLSLPGVCDAVVSHPPGDTITEAMKGRLAQITVRVLGQADSIEEMQESMLRCQTMIRVISQEGEDMVLPGLERLDFEGNIYEHAIR